MEKRLVATIIALLAAAIFISGCTINVNAPGDDGGQQNQEQSQEQQQEQQNQPAAGSQQQSQSPQQAQQQSQAQNQQQQQQPATQPAQNQTQQQNQSQTQNQTQQQQQAAPPAAPYCGDGNLDEGEACDVGTKGKLSGNGCPSGQYCSGCKCYTAAMPISCKANHQYAVSTGLNNFIWTTLPACGDDCADLFGMDYKCDLRTCTCIPKDVTSHTCGNDFKEAMEECDGYQDWYCNSNEVCSGDCECVVGTPGTCGNGVKEVTEQCDGADDSLCPGSCQSNCRCPAAKSSGLVLVYESFTGTTVNHTNQTVAIAAQCGNNAREGSEECDGTDRGLCASSQTCTSNCVCVQATTAACGNGVKEGSEQCDGADRSACTSSQTCNQQCQCQAVQQQSQCGNQIVEAGEECEASSGCGANYSCISCHCQCTDSDADLVCDFNDNCPNNYNPGQGDHDGDGIGDVCDPVPVNCAAECQSLGLTNYAQAQNNQAACNAKMDADAQAALNALASKTCFTTCKYSETNSTYTTINMNNQVTFGCCCIGPVAAWKDEYACTDCPGQNPVCPPAAQVC